VWRHPICRLLQVQQETLIVWGYNDEILDPKFAIQFEETLPNGKLVWVEECGHCAHLEQPQFLCDQILEFISPNQ
jgi:pimeloyl-ACP methyl ester carboxylesterase